MLSLDWIARAFSRAMASRHLHWVEPPAKAEQNPKLSPRQVQACKHHKPPTFRYKGKSR